jgi:hypothetical protein
LKKIITAAPVKPEKPIQLKKALSRPKPTSEMKLNKIFPFTATVYVKPRKKVRTIPTWLKKIITAAPVKPEKPIQLKKALSRPKPTSEMKLNKIFPFTATVYVKPSKRHVRKIPATIQEIIENTPTEKPEMIVSIPLERITTLPSQLLESYEAIRNIARLHQTEYYHQIDNFDELVQNGFRSSDDDESQLPCVEKYRLCDVFPFKAELFIKPTKKPYRLIPKWLRSIIYNEPENYTLKTIFPFSNDLYAKPSKTRPVTMWKKNLKAFVEKKTTRKGDHQMYVAPTLRCPTVVYDKKIIRSKGVSDPETIAEYLVQRKATRPLPLDSCIKPIYGPHLATVHVPQIIITPPSPVKEKDYLNYGTVEVPIDSFLNELLGNVETPINDNDSQDDAADESDAMRKQLEEDLYLSSDDDDDDDDSNIYYGAGNTTEFKTKYVDIIELNSRYIKKFSTHLKDYKIQFKKEIPNVISDVDLATRALKEMIEFAKKSTDYKPDDRINIVVKNDRLFYPISTGFLKDDFLTKLLQKVEQILTSDQTVDITKSTFHLQIVNIPRAGAHQRILNLKKNVHTKSSIVEIKNDNDNLCAARAILVGLTYFKDIEILGRTLDQNQIKYLRTNRGRLQTDLAYELAAMIQYDHSSSEGFSLDDIRAVEEALNIRVIIICAENFNSVIYKGLDIDADLPRVYLYKIKNHYNTIVKLNAFYSSSYYCEKCFKPYQNKSGHSCSKSKESALCLMCMQPEHNSSVKDKIYCKACNRFCYNDECLKEHEFSVCFVAYKCRRCNKLELRENEDEHKCGVSKCRNCGFVGKRRDHRCFMQSKLAKGGKCEGGCSACSPPKFVTVEVPITSSSSIEEHECVVNKPNFDECVKAQYRKMVLQHHPDKETGNHEECVKLNNAYAEIRALSAPLTCSQFHENEETFKVLGVECETKVGSFTKEKVVIELPLSDYNKKCSFTERYIFFDFEAQQNTGIHIGNFIAAHTFKGERFSFDSTDSFCSWLISEEHRNYTCISHYGKCYDNVFVLNYLVKSGIKPYTIYNGTKLLLIEIPALKMKFIDSHNFVSAPLASFPKTFGLTELKKGYFPHLFNTKENEKYVGSIPDAEYYSPDSMKEDAREAFLKWHSERVAENYVFDFDKELKEYCHSDVDILRRSCLELRKEFLEIANIDPFQYVTLPAVCMAIFRSKYLKPETIGVFETEFRIDKYSAESIRWLMSFENNNIVHALNGGEVTIAGAKVDGYDSTKRVVYAYHGCWWHGCPTCFRADSLNYVKRETMEDLYAKTMHRSAKIRALNYTLIEVWECEWLKSALRKQWKNYEVLEPLNPRDAYTGGRVETFKLKASSNEETKIKYCDICSLYPTAMFYDKYPLGHPEKIIKPNYFDRNWFGLIKCRVLPPQNLYIPVLPIKAGKDAKLVFALCKLCAEQRQARCSHTDYERSFVGTYTSIEIECAIAKGYVISEIFEVWHFQTTTDIFKPYISDFMKIKLQSSPHSYESNQAYADDVKMRQGFELDVDKIEINPVKRALAKLAMNSLYGKFAQAQNYPQTTFIQEPSELYNLLLNDKAQDLHLIYLNDEMIQATYKMKDMFVKNNYNTNVFIALMTTANARTRLLQGLDQVGDRVLYCDTDSIVYQDTGSNTIPTGDLLGNWTDELNGAYITKWISSGPKSYYYETSDKKVKKVTKIKGFTLNHRNLVSLNGCTLEKLIDCEIDSVSVTDCQITRDMKTKQLVNKDITKTMRFDFDKRVMKDNYDTLPYGYRCT